VLLYRDDGTAAKEKFKETPSIIIIIVVIVPTIPRRLASRSIDVFRLLTLMEACFICDETAGFWMLSMDPDHAIGIVVVRTVSCTPSCLQKIHG